MKPRPAATSSPATRQIFLSVAKVVTVFVFFSLGYSLALLSSSRSEKPHPDAAVSSEEAATTTTTVELSCPPSPVTFMQQRPPLDLLRFRSSCSPPLQSQEVRNTLVQKMFDGKEPFANFPSPETSSRLLPPKPNPRGWGSRGAVFSDLIAQVRPSVIIELGAFLGASAIHMAFVARNVSLPVLILAVDDFRGWPGFRHRFRRDVPESANGEAMLLPQFMANVVGAGVNRTVMPVPFSTSSALAAMCEWGVYGDLIEVDAGHDFHSAWADINMAWAVLRPGGVMFGHDYFTKADDRGVRRAVTLFSRLNGVRVRPHGEHWVLSPKPRR